MCVLVESVLGGGSDKIFSGKGFQRRGRGGRRGRRVKGNGLDYEEARRGLRQ